MTFGSSAAAARCGEAWTYDETLQDRPIEAIVLLMCEKECCEHTRNIVTGAWTDTAHA